VNIFSAPEWPPSAQIGRQLSLAEMKVHGIDWMKNKTWDKYEMPSFPLFSLIAATEEFDHIDFLSLDVQGAEIGILENYPYDICPIKIIVAEVFTFNETTRQYLHDFMITKGYTRIEANSADYVFALDSIIKE
jgi:hypothetical protein